MKELWLAIELKNKYNQMPLKNVVEEFEEFSNQKIPKEAIDDFLFVGLNNVEFLTSTWLNNYGLKNLPQSIEINEKGKNIKT